MKRARENANTGDNFKEAEQQRQPGGRALPRTTPRTLPKTTRGLMLQRRRSRKPSPRGAQSSAPGESAAKLNVHTKTMPVRASIAVGREDHDGDAGQAGAQGEEQGKQGPARRSQPDASAEGALTFDVLPGVVEQEEEEDSKLGSAIAYTAPITQGGGTPRGFGVTRSRLSRFTNVSITPPIMGSIFVSADLSYTISWQVRSGTGPSGQADVPSPNAQVLTEDNYEQAASDLTPDMGDLNGRPPRSDFWAEDLTARHEEFHARERATYGEQGANAARDWLNTQSVASQGDVPDLLNQAWREQVREHIDRNMTNPGKEERAYGDGVPQYRARATAISVKGDAGGYS